MTPSSIVFHPKSPNFSSQKIEVEFVVVHYTACSLERTLEIFYDPAKKVCAHFVIGLDGKIHDLGTFWDLEIYQGAHAGQSRFGLGSKVWEKLNECSIGIEIVNLNGNVFTYTDAQYQALKILGSRLIERFPKLADPNRFVGHEQIAGFRGKCDPGALFEWNRFYKSIFPGQSPFPERLPLLNIDQTKRLIDYVAGISAEEKQQLSFWSQLSESLEKGRFP